MIKNVVPYFLRLSYLYESDHGLFAEEEFRRLIDLEARRAARSKTVSLLLLLDITAFQGRRELDWITRNVASALFASTREVDAKGWYQYPDVLGVLATDVAATYDSICSTRNDITDELRVSLVGTLDEQDVRRIRFSCRTVPSLPCSIDFALKRMNSIVEHAASIR